MLKKIGGCLLPTNQENTTYNEWMNETFILVSTITIVNEKQLYDKNEMKKVLHNIIGYITD